MKTLSKYARLFDNTNVNWNANVLDSRRFLKCVERYANDLLKRRGTIFLNDIYEMLGFERTQKGSIEIDFNVDGSVINYLKD